MAYWKATIVWRRWLSVRELMRPGLPDDCIELAGVPNRNEVCGTKQQ